MPQPPSRPVLGSRSPEGAFQFFQPRFIDHFFEGRNPHDYLKFDIYGRLFPREIHLCLFFFFAALALYLSSLSWSPFPGLPSNLLLSALPIDPVPPVLNPLWVFCIHVADSFLPASLPVSAFASLFSAVFGALSVSLLASILINVGYVIRNEPGPASFFFEAYARRLSVVSGCLFLMVCPPFWFAATRSLPHVFHVFLLLVSVRLFTRYQHWGRKLDLALLGASYGLGLSESSAFLLFLPFFLVLVYREIFRWHAIRSWHCHLVFWSSLLAAASLVFPNAAMLVHRGRFLDLYPSVFSAVQAFFSAELAELQSVRFSYGFFVLVAFLAIPWLSCFILSRRSPWFFDGPQTIVHLVCAAGLFCIALNLPFSPWNLMYTFPLVIVPYVVMAGSFGYSIGEFFIHGDFNLLVEITLYSKTLRWSAFILSFLAPFALVVAAVLNFPVLSARHSSFVADAASRILDERAPKQFVFFSTGLLDNALRIRAHELRSPVVAVSLPRISSPLYLKGLSVFFAGDEQKAAIEKGNIDAFVHAVGSASVGVIDFPDFFRPFGVIVPSAFHYSLADDFHQLDWLDVARAQRPAIDALKAVRSLPIHPNNPLFTFRISFLRLASKNLNNLAMFLIESSHTREAFELLLDAYSIDPENLSVLFNIASFAAEFDLPEGFDPEEQLERCAPAAHGNRWNLAYAYGYVHDARSWVRRGFVWALSGTPYPPLNPDKILYIDPDEDALFVQWLEIAFTRYGTPLPEENACRGRLQANDHDSSALLDLAFLALRHKDQEIANAYLAEAISTGLAEEDILLYRAMIFYLNGQKPEALDLVRDIASYDAKSGEAWTSLLLLAEELDDDRDVQRALKAIALIRPGTIGLHLSMARYFMNREEWADAQKSLDAAAQLDPSLPFVWELMGEVASKTGDAPLMHAALNALQKRNPDHYLKFMDEGLAAFSSGNLAKAEERFRKGLLQHRDPILLNNLAHVLLLRGSDLNVALNYVNEAIQRNPTEFSFLSTRAAIFSAMGRHEDAIQDYLRLRSFDRINASRIVPFVRELVVAGRVDDAKKESLRFLREHPDSSASLKNELRSILAPYLPRR